MAAVFRALAVVLSIGAGTVFAATDCACDPAQPETLKARQCSLCNEAEKQAADVRVFILKDISPRKPNRYLALPRKHGSALHHLHDMTQDERTELWTAAIAKAKELWGEEWGVAYNGEQVRTQCHTHIHIGKILKGIETKNFIVIRHPSQIPAPPGEGIWIHGDGKGRMHVHLGEQTTETALLR
jgi:diadenosine tetraphosphate (Ap4A) HIT family hydrolase